jgi:hypothetical protein
MLSQPPTVSVAPNTESSLGPDGLREPLSLHRI